MKKTLLVIGDLMMSQRRSAPSLGRFITFKSKLNRRKVGFVLVTYDDVVKNRLPNIIAHRLKIMLFFPYSYWNTHIERYDKDQRVYGDMHFGNDYKRFFLKVRASLRRRYKDKDLTFVNPPVSCIIDRDKIKTDRILGKAGIITPNIYKIRTLSQIERLIDDGKNIYIKPRFGAMGKGITYLSGKGCYTNFLFKKGRIVSRLYDYNWRTARISEEKREDFLKSLIGKGFFFQEAVQTPIVSGRKFDIRVYVIYSKVPYLYAKSAPQSNLITNWSQGGRLEKGAFLNKALPKATIEKIKKAAKKGARALDLNYAGVDIILDKDHNIYMLEIQSFPGYERGFDLMRFLADSI